MQARKSGFTLVELLVVVAILTILAGLLLPALGKALYTARMVTCASQLKQIALAWTTYAGDSHGYYPTYDLKSLPATYSFAGRRSPHQWFNGDSRAPMGDLRPLIDPYLGGAKNLDPVNTCPLEIPAWQENGMWGDKKLDRFNADGSWAMWQAQGSPYAIYSFANCEDKSVHPLDRSMGKVGQTWSPASYDPDDLQFDILVSDHFGWENPYADRSWFGPKSSHYSRAGGSIPSHSFANSCWPSWNTPIDQAVSASFARSDLSVKIYGNIHPYLGRQEGTLRNFHHSKGLMVPAELAK